MSSGYQKYSQPIPIVFPKRQTLGEKNESTYMTNPLYEIASATDRFDPNSVNSPPNHFVENLMQRMDQYYSRHLNTDVVRSRANSFSVGCLPLHIQNAAPCGGSYE